MRIVLVGAGAVGYHLVKELSSDGHALSVIDSDPARIERVRDRHDVLTVVGSATSRETLDAAGTRGADMFIAVSNVDEVNVLACAAAHGLGVHRTLARVRNADFTADEPLVDPLRLGITRYINPDVTAVDTIEALVDAPGSIDVGDFCGGAVLLRSFDVAEGSALAGRPLRQLREDFAGERFFIAAVRRDGEQKVPSGDDVLQPGDRAYTLLARQSLPVFRRVVSGGREADRIVVYGAGAMGTDIARRLRRRAAVTLVDEDADLCEAAATHLEGVLVLAGSINDSDVVRESGLRDADLFVAAGADEEHNLILALLAKKRGARRNVLVTADPDLTLLLADLDVDVVVNPRLTMVGRVLRWVEEGRLQAVQKLGDSASEVLELVVRGGARAAGRTLRTLRLPQGAVLGALSRGDEVFVPRADTRLEEGDSVVAFVLPGLRRRVEKLFERRGGLLFGRGGEADKGPDGEQGTGT
ncbi:MAG: Trk system potassium transporter TrkA [Planctomycetes bacterium]|nr:Trk system potassium transporter TrkA [Planctomycetota bacterium]